ncbi:hypothetical protein [Amycolatopsis jejuensis]
MAALLAEGLSNGEIAAKLFVHHHRLTPRPPFREGNLHGI